MITELKDITPNFVSYVDKGANKKTFFYMKSESESENNIEIQIPIFYKKESPQKLVFGVVYAPNEVDAHGDFATPEEIEKAAHRFLMNACNIDTQHDCVKGAGKVVESYVAPADFKFGETEIKKGSWVLVTKATDEVWEKITKGEITGYSMSGVAVKVTKENVDKSHETNEFNSFMDNIKEMFKMFKSKDNKYSNYQKEITDMTRDEFEEILQRSLEPIKTKLEQLETGKEEPKEESQETQVDEAAVSKVQTNLNGSISKQELEEIITKSIEPVKVRIEQLEKSRAVSNRIEDYEKASVKQQDNIFKGISI